jgi:hypothetical protein
MKPTLKASGTKRSKPKYDEALSKFAFKFNLHHYTVVEHAAALGAHAADAVERRGGMVQLETRVKSAWFGA